MSAEMADMENKTCKQPMQSPKRVSRCAIGLGNRVFMVAPDKGNLKDFGDGRIETMDLGANCKCNVHDIVHIYNCKPNCAPTTGMYNSHVDQTLTIVGNVV